MRNNPPGTRALAIFEAAARHLNFTRAAGEVGLTTAAVSHQIREIEDQLGVALFTRTSRSVQLTPAGRIMLDATVDALESLRRAVGRARKTARGQTMLRVSSDATMASKWLMPRVESFRKAHPDIELRFDVSWELRDFDRDDIDVAIRFGSGKYPGLRADRMFDNVIIPICSPELLLSGKPIAEPRDLLNHTLAHVDWTWQGITWPNWRMWMTAAGIKDFDDSRCIVLEDSSQAIQMAMFGGAVALVDFTMVAADLSAGRLVRPFELGIKVPPEYACFVVYPEATADDPRIVAFRDWVLEEAGRTI